MSILGASSTNFGNGLNHIKRERIRYKLANSPRVKVSIRSGSVTADFPLQWLRRYFAVGETYTILAHANVLRVHAELDERFTLSDSIGVVELENENGHTTLWRERHDSCTFQPEV